MANEFLMSVVCLLTFAKLIWDTGQLNIRVVSEDDSTEEESEDETAKPICAQETSALATFS